jgi:hemolysin activation/secretion protein
MRARRLPLAFGIAYACTSVIPASEAAEPVAPNAITAEQPVARFDLVELRVLGNTVLKNRQIEAAIYPFLGRNRSIQDVEAARTALEAAYHDAGYATVFVDIPEQQVEDGLVRLQVTEGKVDRVRVQGTRYFSNRWIRESIQQLDAGNVPKLPVLQSELATLNSRTPDLSVTPVLKAGRTPGTVDVNLKVADTLPLHGSLELNDRYTANTSKLRIAASVNYNNLWQAQHSLAFQYQSSVEKPSEVRAIVGSYSMPVPSVDGLSLAFYGVDSKSDVAAVGTISVLGTGRIWGARAVFAPRAPGETTLHTTTLGLDYKNFLESIRLKDGTSLLTPVHYINWSAAHTIAVLRPKYQLQMDFTGNFGVRGVVNDSNEFFNKRFNGTPNYFNFKLGSQYTRQLAAHLQGYGRIGAQYTPYALVSNEQLAIGGFDTVRGYTEAAELGDRGWDASVELRSNFFAKAMHLPEGLVHGFIFFDYGRVSVVDPLPKQIEKAELASYGFGLRLLPWHGISADLEYARAAKDSTATKKDAQRAHLTLKWQK